MKPRAHRIRVRAKSLALRQLHHLLEASNRLRLPGPSVLPFAGAVVGLYSGLAAGLFSSLIALVSGVCFGFPQLLDAFRPDSPTQRELGEAFAQARWHFELLIVGVPLGMAALGLSRLIRPGGPRTLVKRRLEVLSLLTLGALSLYYPLVALAAINTVLGHAHDVARAVKDLAPWVVLLAPALGGAVVGRLLRDDPETHGHGVPEVVRALQREGAGMRSRQGLLKLVASAVTIGSGGSAGREGPIVFGGAAFGSSVGRTLGFTRGELAILLASGAGAGIAASFNAPIAGAIFAMEILLRQFELKVFSPIILASVTATLVGRGTMGSASMLERVAYSMVSGGEIVAYAVLGLVCGGVAYAFVRALHGSEDLFNGRLPGKLSPFLGRRPLWLRAGLGGLFVGALALVLPITWGTGHEFANDATMNALPLWMLAVGCVFKLVATAVTLGSGGSGGTFFPATVIGAMAGGTFGELLHRALPNATAPGGAYAMVGMGAAVGAMTRGPFTGMMMIYELSGNYAIILPLMVSCTIASSLCHALVERHHARAPRTASVRERMPLVGFVAWAAPLAFDTPAPQVRDLLLTASGGALPVAGADGALLGVVCQHDFSERWRQLPGDPLAAELAQPAEPVAPTLTVAEALERMARAGLEALPVRDEARVGVVTRAALRRFLGGATSGDSHATAAVAATELR